MSITLLNHEQKSQRPQGTSAVLLFKATAGQKAKVQSFSVNNTTETGHTYTLYLVPNGSFPGSSNELLQRDLGARASKIVPEALQLILEDEAEIWVQSSSGSALNFFASLVEFTD